MSVERARGHLARFDAEGRILQFEASTATVELAARAIGVEPARIAKSLSFKIGERTLLVVAAGDARVDNSKYKQTFGEKARMLSAEEVLSRVGHAVGGVCPFGVNEEVEVYLDRSMERFTTVFPAAGSANACIEMTLAELEKIAGAARWVDVCKLPEEQRGEN